MKTWTAQLRTRVHPLWRLRQSRAYRWFQSTFDFAISMRMGRVRRYSYALRDLPLWFPHAEAEPQMVSLITRLSGRAEFDCFVDVGANVGTYSWLVANLWPRAKLLLFEPDPRNIGLLRRTIRQSDLSNASLHAVALSDSTGDARFIVDDASGAAGSLIDQRGGLNNLQRSYRLTREITVETRRLDEFHADLACGRLLVKVDAEGAEARVLAGAARVLAELRPVVLCETFGGNALGTLRAARYRIFPVDENSNYLALPAEDAALATGLGVAEVQ